jgi:endonuclease/exonuclease/phosphatase family metal-dependent hydrolase
LRASEHRDLQDPHDYGNLLSKGADLEDIGELWASHRELYLDDDKIRKRADRMVLLVSLRDQLAGNRSLVVTATHLQRNPEAAEKDKLRLAEMVQVNFFVRDFASRHKLELRPTLDESTGKYLAPRDAVVVAGDFNSARAHAMVGLDAPTVVHRLAGLCSAFPLRFQGLDGDDSCTTTTETRRVWIDYLFYHGFAFDLIDVFKDPCPAGAIPDASHPSDHVPIAMRVAWRSHAEELSASTFGFRDGRRESKCSPPQAVQPFRVLD